MNEYGIKRISDIKAFQKPQDSIFSKLFSRKLSRVLSYAMIRWYPAITPNQVSVISFLLALIACTLFLHELHWVRAIGVVLIQLSFAFDCSDGEISRIKNLSSKFGGWLDSVLDRFKEALMLGSMTLSWYLHAQASAWVLVLGFAAIIGLQMVSYLREAKRSAWPSQRTSEIFIAKDIYVGTVDVTVYLVSFAVLLHLEIYGLGLFFLVSLPLLAKQMLSAYRLSQKA